MDRSQGTYEEYAGVVAVELPDGRSLACKPLTVKEAVPFIRMLHAAEQGDADAHFEFLEAFPARVGVAEEVLSPYEVFELARNFLRLRTWTSPTSPEEETARTPGESGSTM